MRVRKAMFTAAAAVAAVTSGVGTLGVAGADPSIAIAPRGTVNSLGGAVLSVAVTCPEGSFIKYIFANAQQSVGRNSSVSGGTGTSLDTPCTGLPLPFTLTIYPNSHDSGAGKFAGGKARASAGADIYNPTDDSWSNPNTDFVQVQLSGKK